MHAQPDASSAGESGDELETLLAAEFGDSDDHSSPSRGEPEEQQEQPDQEPASKRRRTDAGNGAAAAATVCPPHPGTVHGLCIRCGAALGSQEAAAEGSVALGYIHRGLQLSAAEAARLREGDTRRVLSARRLLLVLDLDHTLLNSTRFDEVPPELEERLQSAHAAEEGSAQQSLFRLPALGLWTKLRPGVREFLKAAAQLAELAVYTHGDRAYARAMAALLDPGRTLFGDRLISQADSTRRGVKHLDVVLGAESAAVILDDTAAVWPTHVANLIQVERYLFFPADAERFHRPPSLLQAGREECASQGQLAIAGRVLAQLHARVFADSPSTAAPDVRPHLAALRAGVLAGTVLCFTQVIPLGAAKPAEHPLWRLALQLGAAVSPELGSEVTHVVAGSGQTAKAQQARQRGLPLVSPDWLHACGFLWARAEEGRFPVGEAQQVSVSEAAELAAAAAAAGGGRGDGGGEGDAGE